MSTWTITTQNTEQYGTAATAADAWDAAYRAAADHVEHAEDMLGAITLEVDGDRASVHPAETGDRSTDRAATLEVIASQRVAAVTAHQVAE